MSEELPFEGNPEELPLKETHFDRIIGIPPIGTNISQNIQQMIQLQEQMQKKIDVLEKRIQKIASIVEAGYQKGGGSTQEVELTVNALLDEGGELNPEKLEGLFLTNRVSTEKKAILLTQAITGTNPGAVPTQNEREEKTFPTLHPIWDRKQRPSDLANTFENDENFRMTFQHWRIVQVVYACLQCKRICILEQARQNPKGKYSIGFQIRSILNKLKRLHELNVKSISMTKRYFVGDFVNPLQKRDK